MWLPEPIYERLPQFWLLLGLIFIAFGIYLGLDISAAEGSAIAGIICALYGAGVRIVRIQHRRRVMNADSLSVPSAE